MRVTRLFCSLLFAAAIILLCAAGQPGFSLASAESVPEARALLRYIPLPDSQPVPGLHGKKNSVPLPELPEYAVASDLPEAMLPPVVMAGRSLTQLLADVQNTGSPKKKIFSMYTGGRLAFRPALCQTGRVTPVTTLPPLTDKTHETFPFDPRSPCLPLLG